MSAPALERLLARAVEAYELRGEAPDLEALCRDTPELRPALESLVAEFLRVSQALGSGPVRALAPFAGPHTTSLAPLPTFPGFRTIERIGAGGMGEVYKLQDLALGRMVAAKQLRPDTRIGAAYGNALEEARALALFGDPRVVQVFEFRADAHPPVIIMEYVEGFELGRIGRSLEPSQRARILLDVCDAIHRAHQLGIQHRDLKPSNIMLDAALRPKILDFGLAARDPARGHFVGTLPYLAPEQLDPSASIDARADVYALGVVLYELLCGTLPYSGRDEAEVLAQIRQGAVRLPTEIDASAPEPLQAIALKAMERDPARRYQTAREMALDLERYLAGRPVLARPSQYASALATRVRPHLEQIQDWLRLRLIYPHEASRLAQAYRDLEGRDDDWILAGRILSYSQIALYLGAFFLICGSLFYFGAYQFHGAIRGVLQPFAVLAVPFVGLNLTAYALSRREHRAVSVAFYLAGVALLPLFLLIVLRETGTWNVPTGTPGQLFDDGVSNRQLQVTILAACAWSAWLAVRTRTVALSTVFHVVLFLFGLAVLADFGLRAFLEEGRWDLLALHIAPLAIVYAGLGSLQQQARPWFSRPAFLASALVLVASLELLALNGKAFHYLGLSLRGFQSADVADPLLLDTLAAMTLNGLLIYLLGIASERWAPEVTGPTTRLLYTISPFALLAPIGYLAKTGQYSPGWDWAYLALALVVATLSHQRQRRSFYYAGILNCAVGLFVVADHRDWFERPAWAVAVILGGLFGLLVGFALAAREKRAAE